MEVPSGAFKNMKLDKQPSMTPLVPLDETREPADETEQNVPTGVAPRRVRTPSKIPYAETCRLLIPIDEVELFAIAKYKVYAAVGGNPHAMTSVKCLINTNAGPNLVNRSFLRPTWISRIKQYYTATLLQIEVCKRAADRAAGIYHVTLADGRSVFPTIFRSRRQTRG